MKSLRTLLPALIACLLTLLVANAWARHADQHRPPGSSGPLDAVDPAAQKAIIAHDIGNVRMTLSNWGELGNPDGVPGYKGFEFPLNSGNDFLFSAGIWIGAELSGVNYVSTTTDGDNGTNEFYPVHIGTVPIARSSNNFGDWFVASKNFAEFNTLPYAYGIKGVDDDHDWTTADDLDGNGQPSDNWDGDSLDSNHDGNFKYDPERHIDEDPAGDITHWYLDPDYVPGPYDDDGDGQADEDGNARGVQEYLTVIHDDIEQQYVGSPGPGPTEHNPLNIVISQRSYAFPEAYAGDFILLDYRIRNIGLLPLKKVFIAVFADADVGAAGEGGDPASLDDSTFYDPDRLMMVMTDSNTDGDGAAPGAIAFRVVKTPVELNQLLLTYANFERVSGGDPESDADKYTLISSGEVAPASDRYGDWRMLQAFGDASGPGFEIPPNGELPITIAIMAGTDIANIRRNAEWALAMYQNDFQGPSSPDVPNFSLEVHPDRVVIRWDDNAEASVDAITALHDFEGYSIERSTDQLTWQTIAAYDVIDRLDTVQVSPDSFYVDTTRREFEWANFNLGMPPHCDAPNDTLYCFEDAGLIPGHTYYYVVRAYDKGVVGAESADSPFLFSGRTGNIQSSITARNTTTGAPKDLSQIYVYPNPYKGSHSGESGGQVNPSKGLIEYPRKLYFMGLPADGTCIIRIFSLAGDHLTSINHSAGPYHGTEYDQWDLITKNSQEIVSGIYYYTVEYTAPGGSAEQFIDKFVVIK